VITRRKPSASMPTPPPWTPAAPEDAYQWSAAFRSYGERWDPFPHGVPSHP
jgi:hypothetical protein